MAHNLYFLEFEKNGKEYNPRNSDLHNTFSSLRDCMVCARNARTLFRKNVTIKVTLMRLDCPENMFRTLTTL